MAVQLLGKGMAAVDYGPLCATVLASRKGDLLSKLALEGARYARYLLDELARHLPVLKTKSSVVEPSSKYPRVVNDMILATQLVGDPELTPLAAVAGTVADAVADYLTKGGATKVIVNNGGDISIRLKEGEKANIGLRLDLRQKEPQYFIMVGEDCGICTSGVGGRSFTLGVADAVTVLANNGAVADAAATYMSNKTTVDSPSVRRKYAEVVYPDTDIPGKAVTVSVGPLSEAEIETALKSGEEEALRLIDRCVIYGAVISVKKRVLPLAVKLYPLVVD